MSVDLCMYLMYSVHCHLMNLEILKYKDVEILSYSEHVLYQYDLDFLYAFHELTLLAQIYSMCSQDRHTLGCVLIRPHLSLCFLCGVSVNLFCRLLWAQLLFIDDFQADMSSTFRVQSLTCDSLTLRSFVFLEEGTKPKIIF